MSHKLRSLIISRCEAEESVFLEMLAHQGHSIPAKAGAILNNLRAVFVFLSNSQMILHTWNLVSVVCIHAES